MNKVKDFIQSEKSMSVINLLFFLAVLAPYRGIIFAACGLWIVFLAYSIHAAQSKTSKILYGVVMLIPAALIAANLYVMMTHAG